MALAWNEFTGEWEERPEAPETIAGDTPPISMLEALRRGWNALQNPKYRGPMATPIPPFAELGDSPPLPTGGEPWGPLADAINAPRQYNPWRTPPPWEQPAPTPTPTPTASVKREKKPKAGTKSQYSAAPKATTVQEGENRVLSDMLTETPSVDFETPEFTPRMDVNKELMGIYESMPSSLEDLAGPRPTVERPKGFLQNALASILLGGHKGGKEGYFKGKEAELQKTWAEEAGFQKERANLKKEMMLKSFENRIEQTRDIREKEMQAYANLGKANEALLENPAYVSGLYRDLPKDYVDKLMAKSVDPKTGKFKSTGPLYLSPEERWNIKRAHMATVLKDLGITDKKQAIALTLSPDKYLEAYYDSLGSLEKRLTWLMTNAPQTTETKAEIGKIQATIMAINSKAQQVPEYLALGQKLGMYEKIKQRDIAVAKATIKDPQALKERTDFITSYWADMRDLAVHENAGGAAGVALRKQAAASQAENPELKVWQAAFPTISKVAGTTTAGKTMSDIQGSIDTLSSHPRGIDVVKWANDPKNLGPIERRNFNTLYRYGIGLIGGYYKDVLDQAMETFGRNKIPFENVYRATILLHADPSNKEAVIAALLAGASK